MTSNKKQGSNWHLLLVGVVLVSVITAGAFWITPLDFNKAKNSINNKVKNVNWGFGETKVITTNTETDEQGKVLKITESEQTKSGKTLWDWLDLLAVPVLIAGFGLWFQSKQDKREREIAQDNLADEAIQAYLKSMGDILLNEEHRKKLFAEKLFAYDNSVPDVARALTIAILRKLEGDKKRQERIIYFLRDAELYQFIFIKVCLPEIDLPEVKLSKANLQQAYLRQANLQGANLRQANLQQADLGEANLQGANLEGANLKGANLNGVKNLICKQIKSACFWEEAIYKGEWHWKQETETWVAKNKQAQLDNTNYIEKLKQDKSSDPIGGDDCSRWEK